MTHTIGTHQPPGHSPMIHSLQIGVIGAINFIGREEKKKRKEKKKKKKEEKS